MDSYTMDLASGNRGDFTQLEALCKAMYEGTDAAQRSEAEATLLPLGTSAENISTCISILSYSNAPLAQLFAASSLLKIVSTQWGRVSVQERVDMRNFCLKFLVGRGIAADTEIPTRLGLFSSSYCL